MNEKGNIKKDKNRIIEIVLAVVGITLLVVGVVLIFKHMNNEPIIKKKDTIIDEKESRYTITKNSAQQQFYSNEYQIVDNEKKQPLDELLEIGQNPIIAFEKLNGRYYAFVAEGLRIRIFLASEA